MAKKQCLLEKKQAKTNDITQDCVIEECTKQENEKEPKVGCDFENITKDLIELAGFLGISQKS